MLPRAPVADVGDHGRDARRGVGFLVGLTVTAIPAWDAYLQNDLRSAVASVGLGGRGGIPAALLFAIVLASLVLVAMVVAWRLRHGRATVVIMICAMLGLGSTCVSSSEIARRRSSAVERWPACSSTEMQGGERCLPPAEHAAKQQAAAKRRWNERDGEVLDGFKQVWSHFPKDRPRVLIAPLVQLGLFALDLALARRVGRRQGAPG
jgi:hypothetical protein